MVAGSSPAAATNSTRQKMGRLEHKYSVFYKGAELEIVLHETPSGSCLQAQQLLFPGCTFSLTTRESNYIILGLLESSDLIGAVTSGKTLQEILNR